MNQLLSDQSLTRLRWLTVAVFAGVFSYYIVMTIHWAVICDSSVMHYIVFLLSRGHRPYIDLQDMNMPGAYLTEQWGMAIFGWSDLSWRIYEFVLMAILTLAGMVIGGRRRWLAGIIAASFFIIMHGADGPFVSMERDELMTVLLVAATALLCVALRRHSAILMLPFGLLAGLAVAIKPTVLMLDATLLLILLVILHRRDEKPWPYLGWAVLGNAAIAAIIIGYLLHHGAVGAFLYILRKVLPAYMQTTPHDMSYMLRNLLPAGLWRLAPFAIVAAILRKRRPDWEQWLVLAGAAVGTISYFLQGKGYLYHRYLFVEFLLLWIGIELTDAMRRGDIWSRATGAAGVLVLLLLVLPHYVHVMHRDAQAGNVLGNAGLPNSELTTLLERDLQHLGGSRLNRQVVCLDLVNSCLNGLFRLRLEGNTSFTGDMLLFSPVETPLSRYYRDMFMDLQLKSPGDVVVLGNEWFLNGHPDFRKLDTWPLYKAYLETNYVNVVERKLPGDADAQAYRLFLRKGSAVLAEEQAHPLL